MNKKLFALLTSAALMAGFVPSVFAEEAATGDVKATLEIKPVAATVAADGEATFDVLISCDQKIDTLQFALTADGGEIVDFAIDKEVTKSLGFDDAYFGGKMTEEDKKN